MGLNVEVLTQIKDLVIAGEKDRIQQINGMSYNRKNNGDLALISPPHPTKLFLSGLSSIVNFINEGPDMQTAAPEKTPSAKYLLLCLYNEVRLLSKLNEYNERFAIASVAFNDGEPFPFTSGKYYQAEDFIIKLKSLFADTSHKLLLLKTIAQIKSVASKEIQDDGVTQKVTVAAGIDKVEFKELPPIIELSPIVTFPEVNKQPIVNYVFRAKTESGGFTYALFDSGNTSWKESIAEQIRSYFRKEIKNKNIVIV